MNGSERMFVRAGPVLVQMMVGRFQFPRQAG